jgi:cell division protein FtsL
MTEQEAAVKITGELPGGAKIGATFRDRFDAQTVLLLLIVLGVGLLLYMVNAQENDRERRYTPLGAALAQIISEAQKANKEHAQLLTNQANIINESRIQTYVLTLEPEQRKRLNLAMPDELRARSNPR